MLPATRSTYTVELLCNMVCVQGEALHGDSHSLLCNTFVFLAAASKDLHHTGSYKSLHPHADIIVMYMHNT